MKSLPRLDEDWDRRRVRRPLNPDELKKLLDAAGDRGRKAWYMAAAYAGLRRSEIRKLAWRDVDFENRCIVVRQGKAKREDYLPLHPDLASEFMAIRPDGCKPTQLVFPTAVTDRTRAKDFLRAGIAREEQVLDAEGNPVMVGKRSPRAKTRIVTEDEEGCVIDLHALRTTLGTELARSGVVPQVAQKIMRHSDYNTTLKHYTRLNLIDTAAELEAAIGGAEQRQVKAVLRKTGTDDAVAGEVSIDSATEAVAAQASAETGQDVALAAPIPFSKP
jgi:integrase